MKFIVTTKNIIPKIPNNQAYLVMSNWDDYGYRTLFNLYYIDSKGRHYDFGGVKIGQKNMLKENLSRPQLPKEFINLDDDFFSLGQDDSYYEKINQLSSDLRDEILFGLNDLAKNSNLFDSVYSEPVISISLLRSVTPQSVKGQFSRIANGGSRLVGFNFRFVSPVDETAPAFDISFEVIPESTPPTNIHVLIGRNGVGKTHILSNMISSIFGPNYPIRENGGFFAVNSISNRIIFSNVVAVSFSAFDEKKLYQNLTHINGLRYSYIGLKKQSVKNKFKYVTKSSSTLTKEFVQSLFVCRSGAKKFRWRRAIEMLETDLYFKEANILSLINIDDDEIFKKESSDAFNNLSSGHKIVILTVTRLIETVEEKTLVLLDEPEAHLHPPLLSAFTRVLSDLLIQKNGVAIVATHSPVIVQEVPKSCVWIIRRIGLHVITERPSIECFGENMGLLTREIFGLEVTYSGFHKMIKDEAIELNNYNKVLEKFNGQLGMEARAIVRSIINNID